MSAIGALYGKFIGHAAALASTCREPVELERNDAAMRQVATYPRGQEALYRVVRDTTVNRPYGRFAVYVGERRIGAQLSCPSADDCRRMEYPPALCAPYEVRLSKATRQALGVLSPTEKQQRQLAQREWHRRHKNLIPPREKKGGKT